MEHQTCRECGHDHEYTCRHCGETFYEHNENHDTVYHELCHTCIEEYEPCVNCGDMVHEDDQYSWAHDTYCESCYVDLYLVRCDSCDELFEENELASYPNGCICHDCDDYHYTCEHCGNYVHESRAHYCDCGEHVFCSSSCRDWYECECEHDEDNDDNEEAIHNYHWKPTPIFHGSDKRNVFYGIELETDKYDNRYTCADALLGISNDQTEFWMENDGSLRNGIEVIFHPRSLDNWMDYEETLKNITRIIRAHGGKSFNTTTCGLHVHRSNVDLDEYAIAKLITFFVKNKENIERVAQRRSNNYCSFNSIFNQEDIDRKLDKVQDGKHRADRYYPINFTNRHTIEFRVFKGTLKTSTIMAYIQFAGAVTEYCKACSLERMIDVNHKALWRDFTEYVHEQGYVTLEAYLVHKGLYTAYENNIARVA